MFFKLFFSFLLQFYCGFAVNAKSTTDFVIERCYQCEDVPNQKINFTVTPKTFSYPQVLDLALSTPIPLGNQLKFIANVELENRMLKSWQRLIKVEDDFCRVMQIYMGNFAYDLGTAMGILPRGVCPVPKGNYHAVNYTADYNLLKLQAFPFGKLRVTNKYIEKSSNSMVLCMITILSNLH